MIQVAGGTVWADDTGGPGAAVVLLHPGIGDSRVWDLIAPRLAARYRVIRYDARGHGMSPPATAPFNLLDDLIMVLDQLEVARATMVGCSQGGATSIDLALAQPERVSALVLVSPGLSGYPMPGDPELDAKFEACAEVGDVEGIARLAGGIWTTGEPDDAVLAQLRSAAKAWLANDEYERPGPPAFERLGSDHGAGRAAYRGPGSPAAHRMRRGDRGRHPRVPQDRRPRGRPPAAVAGSGTRRGHGRGVRRLSRRPAPGRAAADPRGTRAGPKGHMSGHRHRLPPAAMAGCQPCEL